MSTKTLLRLILPRLPLIIKTTLSQLLNLTPEASKWDLRTALSVHFLRSLLSSSTSTISKQQQLSCKGSIRGEMWISKLTLPASSPPAASPDTPDSGVDELRNLLCTCIESLKPTTANTATTATAKNQEHYTLPALSPVEAEWTGPRPGVPKDARQPADLSESDKYDRILHETTSDATILYIHGGAMYMCDPASHRPVVSRLAKACGGRALSIRYRLAPAHPFPAALLDCLVAYLNLLYPAPGAPHAPVRPKNVVFAGDSAGGNLSLALTQVLLQIQRDVRDGDGKRLRFNGHTIPLPLPLPAGVATNSPWTDLTRAMPSIARNAHYDYLPPPSASFAGSPFSSSLSPAQQSPQSSTKRKHHPGETLNPRPCALWPRIPPRADLYAEGDMLCHPLVSPLALSADAWAGAPPMWFCCGEEMLADDVEIVARRLAGVGAVPTEVGKGGGGAGERRQRQHGGNVRLEIYEAQPHCFALVIPFSARAARCVDSWGNWIRRVTSRSPEEEEGKNEKRGRALFVSSRDLRETEVDFEGLSEGVSDEECWRRMRGEMERRVRVWDAVVRGEDGGGCESEGDGEDDAGVIARAKL